MAAPISRLYDFVTDSQNLVPISSSEVDAEFDQLVTTVNKICVAQASAPLSPVQGDIWADTTNNLIKLYDGSVWVAMQRIAKGADVASATTTTLGTDGNFFDITGTTGITSIAAMTAGLIVFLQFDGVVTVTDGSNLKLNGNFTSAAGDSLTLISDGTNWWEIARNPAFVPTAANALAGSVVGNGYVFTTDAASGSTALPYDETTPQSSEGDEYMTLAYTPKSATNILEIEAQGAYVGTSGYQTMALFKDSDTDALRCVSSEVSERANVLTHVMTAGTTSAITFKIRIGSSGAGTGYFNGGSGSYDMGGKRSSFIKVTEYKV